MLLQVPRLAFASSKPCCFPPCVLKQAVSALLVRFLKGKTGIIEQWHLPPWLPGGFKGVTTTSVHLTCCACSDSARQVITEFLARWAVTSQGVCLWCRVRCQALSSCSVNSQCVIGGGRDWGAGSRYGQKNGLINGSPACRFHDEPPVSQLLAVFAKAHRALLCLPHWSPGRCSQGLSSASGHLPR